MTTATKIEITRDWRILSIVDTRCYDRESREFVAGTGDLVPCECCGKSIEVHATLEHKTSKDRIVVGTQCAKRASLKFGPEFVSPTNKNWWKRDRFKAVQA
jgi:hypothetical protein